MTEDTFIQWTKSSYAYTNMTVDGLERYPGNKPGLMDLVMQSECGLRIKKLCDKFNVIYAGDTIYTKRKNYDSLYNVREELVDEFIVGPIQWTVNENLIKIRSSLYFYFDSSLHFHWSVVYRFLYF